MQRVRAEEWKQQVRERAVMGQGKAAEVSERDRAFKNVTEKAGGVSPRDRVKVRLLRTGIPRARRQGAGWIGDVHSSSVSFAEPVRDGVVPSDLSGMNGSSLRSD